ncbi:hypothetical protein [Pseudonocardia sp.]|nr:hypothetical protein [Pseudonocardia sp.]
MHDGVSGDEIERGPQALRDLTVEGVACSSACPAAPEDLLSSGDRQS